MMKIEMQRNENKKSKMIINKTKKEKLLQA